MPEARLGGPRGFLRSHRPGQNRGGEEPAPRRYWRPRPCSAPAPREFSLRPTRYFYCARPRARPFFPKRTDYFGYDSCNVEKIFGGTAGATKPTPRTTIGTTTGGERNIDNLFRRKTSHNPQRHEGKAMTNNRPSAAPTMNFWCCLCTTPPASLRPATPLSAPPVPW